MAKNYYLRKLSFKLIPVYIAVVFMTLYSRPMVGSAHYIGGFVLVCLGIFVRTWAAGHLSKNIRLVTSGPYRYVKNPLYVGTFMIVIGICLIAQGPITDYSIQGLFPLLVLAVFLLFFNTYYVPYKKKKEYGRLAKLFPDSWDNYARSVPDYIPNFTAYNGQNDKWAVSSYLNNSEHWTMISIIIVIILVHLNRQILDYIIG